MNELAELGAALELVVVAPVGVVTLAFEEISPESAPAAYRCQLEHRPPLLWSPEWGALLIYLGARRRRRRRRRFDADNEAAEARGAFQGREASGAYELEPRVGPEPWQTLGGGARIDYHSTKWGRSEEYKHRLGGRVGVFLRGNFRAGILAVQGGKLAITPAGIVG